MLDGDVVSEEPRPLAAGVGDQRLLPVEFQPEGFPEEFGYPGLDFLGLRFRPGESQQMIVRVPGISQAAVTG
jgi:hypothetical protein